MSNEGNGAARLVGGFRSRKEVRAATRSSESVVFWTRAARFSLAKSGSGMISVVFIWKTVPQKRKYGHERVRRRRWALGLSRGTRPRMPRATKRDVVRLKPADP